MVVRSTTAKCATVIALLFLIPPFVVGAQPTTKLYRIGVLARRSPTLNAANMDSFRQGLQELGYKEGENLEIVYRSSDGHDERLPDLASELSRLARFGSRAVAGSGRLRSVEFSVWSSSTEKPC
jgi:hypothetical protein